MANLVGPDCQPGAHVKNQTRRGRGGSTYQACGCNQGYITYPARMLWWRCSGYVADDVFPEAGLGLYSPEELGAVVDDEGRPIDVAHVELPPGYGPAEVTSGTGTTATADEADRFDLQFDIYALPAAQLDELGAPDGPWKKAQLPSLWRCTRGQLRSARGLVRAAASLARRNDPDWDHAEAVAALRNGTMAKLAAVLCGAYGPPAPTAEAAPPASDQAPEPEAPQVSEAPPAPGPDMAALRERVAAEVEALSVAEVHTELQAMQPPVPVPTGAQAQRTALVNAEVQRQLLASVPADPEGEPDA